MQISLLNSILTYNKSLSTNDLFNEHKIKKILTELDPQIEIIGSNIELVNDIKIGVRYSNFTSIIDCLTNYFNSKGIKERLDPYFRINYFLEESKFTSNDETQIESLAEVLLVVAFFGSQTNRYSNSLSNEQLENILYYIEKYLTEEVNDTSAVNYNSSFPRKNSVIFNERNELKKDKDLLTELTINQDAEIRKLNDILSQKSIEFNNIKIKLQEYELRSDIMSKQSLEEVQDNLIKCKMENSELTRENNDLKMEISNLENTIKFNEEISQIEISKLQSKVEHMEDKMAEFTSLRKQNEKLNNKLKDLQVLKEKQDKIESNLDNENERINSLLIEKVKLIENINNLKKELKSEKDKNRELEYDKKKSEMDKHLTNTASQMMFTGGKKLSKINFISEIKTNEDNNNKDLNDDDSLILELNNQQSSNILKFNEFNHQNQISTEDKLEYLRINKQQIEEIHKLTEEKEAFIKERSELEDKNEMLNEEKEQILIDKQRLELKISRLELERQKLEIDYEKRKLIDNSQPYQEIINNNKIEIEGLYEKITKLKQENKSLNDNVSRLQKEIQLKVVLLKKAQEKDKDSISPNRKKENRDVSATDKDKEVETLKNELSKVKSNFALLEKNSLKLDEKNKELLNKLKTMCPKEDYESYKRKYEELNNNVQSEHELVSNNLYDLSVLFLGLKQEFQKRIENNKKIK